jgi:hypothetical protein
MLLHAGAAMIGRNSGLDRSVVLAICACLATPLAGGCASPQTGANAAISETKLGDICANSMSFDVAGPYYANCKAYLRQHGRAEVALNTSASEPAEHKACRQVGLAEGSPEYQNCVQEMYQLDLGSAHL